MDPEDGGNRWHSCSSESINNSDLVSASEEQNFSSVHIISRKRRRGGAGVVDKWLSSSEQRQSQHPMRSVTAMLSSTFSLVLLFVFLFVSLVPSAVDSLPFDGSSLTLTSSGGGSSHRSHLDLLIDPIHQAEFDDDDPLETKRVVAKSVFDMVLRTPPPPTSSSNRCPPGTQSPFEGGPCIKKNTDPVALVDQAFLLDTLRGLAEKGELFSGGGRNKKRPGAGSGGGRRRTSGRPGGGGGSRTSPSPTTTTTLSPTTTGMISTVPTTLESSPPTTFTSIGLEEEVLPSSNNGPVFSDESTVVKPLDFVKVEQGDEQVVFASTTPNSISPEDLETTVSVISDKRAVEVISSPEPEIPQVEQINTRSNDTQTTITTSMPLQATETTTTTTFVSTDQEKFGQVHQNLPEWTTPPENVTRPHHHATENFGTREDSSSGNDNDRSVISPKIAEHIPAVYDTFAPTEATLSPPITSSYSSSPSTFEKEELTGNVKDNSDTIQTDIITSTSSSLPALVDPSSMTTLKHSSAEDDLSPRGAVAEGMTGVLMEKTTQISPSVIYHSAKSPTIEDLSDMLLSSSVSLEQPDNSEEDLMKTRMIAQVKKIDEDEPNVLIRDPEIAKELSTDSSDAITSSSLPRMVQQNIENPLVDRIVDGLLLLDTTEVTTVPSSSSVDGNSNSGGVDEEPLQNDGHMSITTTTEEESKEKEGVGKESDVDNEAERVRTKEEPTGAVQLEAEEQMVTTGDMSMTGSTTADVEDKADQEQDKNTGVIDEQQGDGSPSSVSAAAVNHFEGEPVTTAVLGTEVEATSIPHEDDNNDDDLLIINNPPPVSPSTHQENRDEEMNTMNKDKEIDPLPIQHEKSPSSREGQENEDFAGLSGTEPPSKPQVRFPETTLVPPSTTSSSVPQLLLPQRDTLLQFQLPIVTQGPSKHAQEEHGINDFEKFPDFPSATTGKVRFPADDVPVEGGVNQYRGTFKPVFVQDFPLDYPPSRQQWQVAKPFPEASLSPPSSAENLKVQVPQPEFYEAGSAEFLESELDRRHQKTRSRNRIRTPEFPTTNQPLPIELSFYSQNVNPPDSRVVPRAPPTNSPRASSQVPLFPPPSQQPFYFTRRSPSSDLLSFGYLNFRNGHDRFNNNNRRLVW